MLKRIMPVAVLFASLVGACSSTGESADESAAKGASALGAGGSTGTATLGSAAVAACTTSQTDTVTLVDVQLDTGLIDGIRIAPSPVGNAYGLYRHTDRTRHLPSHVPGNPVVPGNLVRPACKGIASAWDARVASASHVVHPSDSRGFLVLLANLSRQSCSADISFDCATGEALSISPASE